MNNTLQDFNAEINRACDAAFKSAKGGDESWNKILESYNIKPLSSKDKEALLNSEMKIATGAFPIELRRVLLAIVLKYSTTQDIQPRSEERRVGKECRL